MLYLRRTGFPKGVLSPFPHSPPEIAGPQSNQRGIESGGLGEDLPHAGEGLNRTSVGLKADSSQTTYPTQTAPQSNQRGIESGDPRVQHRHFDPRLNRTSVGLKGKCLQKAHNETVKPQSNQRGIERRIGEFYTPPALVDASIEPAWD